MKRLQEISFLVLLFFLFCLFIVHTLGVKKLEETKDNKKKFSYDFKSDASIQKYVDDKLSLEDIKNFVPTRKKFLGHWVSSALVPSLREMMNDARKEKIFLRIGSGYRSYNRQKSLYYNAQKKYGSRQRAISKPGHSEHQLGLAIDFNPVNHDFKKTKQHIWLTKNAYKYGFIQSYKKNKSMSGYKKEPWHWRFIGIKLATYLYQNDLEFSEYYYQSHHAEKNS